ncbi:hypothetical protein ACWCP6_04375 [Streptomyces sp. NPDC002004]
MFGMTKHELHVVVLRDADRIATELYRAVAEADDTLRPGLERALAIAEDAARESDDELRARWVHRQLAEAGHEGPSDSVAAIKVLREAMPGLSLLSAVQLTKAAAATTPAAG